MSNDIRRLLRESHPEVYRAGGDPSARQDLLNAATTDPAAVLDVLLEDLIWRVYLEELVQDEETPNLKEIVALAGRGDYDLAHERTRLGFNVERDRKRLLVRFREEVAARLTGDS